MPNPDNIPNLLQNHLDKSTSRPFASTKPPKSLKAFLLQKLIPLAISLTILILVTLFLTPPPTWRQASLSQILLIFLPLFTTALLFLSLFLPQFSQSFILSLFVVILLTLNSLGEFQTSNLILISSLTILLLLVFGNLPIVKLHLWPKLSSPPKPSSRAPQPRKHKATYKFQGSNWRSKPTKTKKP